MRDLLSFVPVLSLAGMLERSRSTDALACFFGKRADQVDRPWLPAADYNFGHNCYRSEQASLGGVIVDGAVSIVAQSNTTAVGGSVAPVLSPSPLSFTPPPRV
jgi:hypothetical protein